MEVKRLEKPKSQKLSKAQTSKECLVCGSGGRTIGYMGDIQLNYCGHHRKYGERVLNFLIRAVFGEKLKNFLKESKDDLFMSNMPRLSDESYEQLANYVNKMIHKLDEVEKWHKKTK